MQKIIYYTGFYFIVSSFILFSCVTGKKPNVSNSGLRQQRKDSIETLRIYKKQASENSKKAAPSVLQTLNDKDNPAPFPPSAVFNAFKMSYPKTSVVIWSKMMPNEEKTKTNSIEYEAFFILNDYKNWEIYSETGALIQAKVEILVDQLPPNIHNAIRNQYPNAFIVLAATYKNMNNDGTYCAKLRTEKNAEAIEVVLKENGTFL